LRLNSGASETFKVLHNNSYQQATPNYMPLSALAARQNATSTPLLFNDPKFQLLTVNLLRKVDGFGFRLVGGSEMGTPLQVGALIKGGAAHQDGRLREGDEIVEIDGRGVVDGRHDVAVNMIKQAAKIGHVKLIVRRLKGLFVWREAFSNTNAFR
jgi:C-terminal processing protease CtpA/Prc